MWLHLLKPTQHNELDVSKIYRMSFPNSTPLSLYSNKTTTRWKNFVDTTKFITSPSWRYKLSSCRILSVCALYTLTHKLFLGGARGNFLKEINTRRHCISHTIRYFFILNSIQIRAEFLWRQSQLYIQKVIKVRFLKHETLLRRTFSGFWLTDNW